MKFSKMHGLGNDFSLFDGVNQQLPDYGFLARAVCDRHFGVGGDGIMVALPSDTADIRMVYYNSDGSEGEMCGNGIRCFSKFVYEKNLLHKPVFSVETAARTEEITLKIREDDLVETISVSLGIPVFENIKIPTTLPGNPVLRQPLKIAGDSFQLTAMRLGVPHCVIVVDDLEVLDLEGVGSQIEWHPAFPSGVNTNFMQVIDRKNIRVKTYERAAHHTLACGTGCSSCVVAGNLLGILEPSVTALTESGGLLKVSVDSDYHVTMEGGAEFICDGKLSPWILCQAATPA